MTPYDISDHDLISVRVTEVQLRRAPEVITIRSTRRLDQDALCLSLLLADWSELDAAQSITDKWDRFRAVWHRRRNRGGPGGQLPTHFFRWGGQPYLLAPPHFLIEALILRGPSVTFRNGRNSLFLKLVHGPKEILLFTD